MSIEQHPLPASEKTIAQDLNGQSNLEIRLMRRAAKIMRTDGRKPGVRIYYITIGDDLVRMDYAQRLEIFSEFLKRITKLQGRAGIPQYAMMIFELLGGIGLHAHMLILADDDMIEKMRNSEMMKPYCQGPKAIRRVYDSDGLESYFGKERITQARNMNGQRTKRRPPTALPGVGDRVRLSAKLEAKAIEKRIIAPGWKTNWNRKKLIGVYDTPLSKGELKRQAKAAATTIQPIRITTMKLSGQICMFPDERPVTSLRDYGGGFMPIALAGKIEFHRKRLGYTQTQLAALIGICQPTFANVLAGRYPLSPWAANRLRETLDQQMMEKMAA